MFCCVMSIVLFHHILIDLMIYVVTLTFMHIATGGKGAYGAIDAIGGATSPKVVAALRKNGKYLLYGALDTAPVSASNGDILAQTKVSCSCDCQAHRFVSPGAQLAGCCTQLWSCSLCLPH